jgi:cell wall-associated NlpC family hydrolase
VARLPVVDLRRGPDHRAELVSQLLLGEPVQVLAAAAGGAWMRVRSLDDHYAGWARSWGLESRSAAGWIERARHRIASLWVMGTRDPEGGPAVTSLLWRGRVELVARRGERSCVELPDGRRAWVAAESLTRLAVRTPLGAAASRLTGIPYLWGGRSVQGFDCSGLVQQLLADSGVSVPRDAHDQWRSCRALRGLGALERGDLIFFGRPRRRLSHVGLALGGGRFVHALGHVQLGHLDPRNPLYDSELMGLVRFAGRPRAGAVRGA